MPNIRKSFNFRDGVQVDEDDFIVRGNLVGIGTTIPAEKLDVQGNASVSGVVTTNNLYSTGTATLTEVRMGAGITMSSTSGIISATEFRGSGANLTNLPTSVWSTAATGLGIYNSGRVGVGTTSPLAQYALQVGGDPGTYPGVGLSTEGHFIVSGISTFRNDVVISTGSSVSFGSTAYFNDKALFGGDLEISNANDVSLIRDTRAGVGATLAIGADKLILRNKDGNENYFEAIDNGSVKIYHDFIPRLETTGLGVTVYGTVDATQLDVTGVSTFRDDVTFTGAAANAVWDKSDNRLEFANNVKASFGTGPDLEIYSVGSGSEARILGTSGIPLRIGGDANNDTTVSINPVYNKAGIVAKPDNSIELYFDGIKRIETTGAGVTISGSQLEVASTTSLAQIAIGQSIGVGNSTAVLKFSNKDLDIYNNDTGNVTMYLHKGAIGVSTGSFDWVYGQTNQQLMTLTYDGSMGLGVAAPTNTLHVVGTSTITSNAWVGGNLSVAGNITGNINYPDVITGTNLHVTTGVSTLSTVSAVKIGINNASPRVELDAFSGTAIFQGVGIGTTNPVATLEVDGVASFDKVGIGTTAMHQITNINTGDIQFHNKKLVSFDQAITVGTNSVGSRLGVGTHAPRCAVDFSDAGSGAVGAAAGFMLIPRVSQSVRDNFQVSAAPGSVIYNTTSNKMQCHNGTAWQDLF